MGLTFKGQQTQDISETSWIGMGRWDACNAGWRITHESIVPQKMTDSKVMAPPTHMGAWSDRNWESGSERKTECLCCRVAHHTQIELSTNKKMTDSKMMALPMHTGAWSDREWESGSAVVRLWHGVHAWLWGVVVKEKWNQNTQNWSCEDNTNRFLCDLQSHH